MLDPHLKLAASMFNTKLPMKERTKVFLRAGKHYALWYPAKWIPFGDDDCNKLLHPALERPMRDVRRLSRKLARGTFHAMLLHGPKLEREQLVLGRLVDIGAELFVLACAVAFAQSKVEDSTSTNAEVDRVTALVAYLGKLARMKCDELFRHLFSPSDREGYAVAKGLAAGA
jgi:hypothetical protein